MSPHTGLALARTSTLVSQTGLLDDTYTTGRLAKKTKGVKLRSLSPLINQYIWDEYFSLCPFLTVSRFSFNPIVESTGSSGCKMQYTSPRFLFCIFLDFINYEYLDFGLNVHLFDHFCSRESLKDLEISDQLNLQNYATRLDEHWPSDEINRVCIFSSLYNIPIEDLR